MFMMRVCILSKNYQQVKMLVSTNISCANDNKGEKNYTCLWKNLINVESKYILRNWVFKGEKGTQFTQRNKDETWTIDKDVLKRMS